MKARLDGVDVALWWARPSALDREQAPRWLSAAELERFGRFKSERAALEYACGHRLLRQRLAALAPIPPRDWRFVHGEHGRPDVDPDQPGLPEDLRALSVNLSHTRGLVLVGLSLSGTLGVDAEYRQRANDLRRLAEAKFSRREQAWLEAAPDEPTFRRRFFEVWTCKEAYLKARGVGITVPLDRFHVAAREQAVQVDFDPGFEPTPDQWTFGLAEVCGEHQLAWGLRGAGSAPQVRLYPAEVDPS